MQTTLWKEQEGTTTVLQLVTAKAAKNLRLLKKKKKKFHLFWEIFYHFNREKK